MKNKKSSKYLTIKEVEQLTGIKESTIRKRIKVGTFTDFIKTGKCGYLIPANKIDNIKSDHGNSFVGIKTVEHRKTVIASIKKKMAEEIEKENKAKKEIQEAGQNQNNIAIDVKLL